MTIASFNAAQGYGLAKTALRPNTAADAANTAKDAGSPSPDPTFEAVHKITQTLAGGEKAASAFVTSGADPHSVIEAIAAAELAVETAVTVRDKVVEAYQELIRMPI